MKLSTQSVKDLLKTCFFCDGEPTENMLTVKVIITTYIFNSNKIEENASKIGELLAELPDEFQTSGGGGWTFLKSCLNKDGKQWTGFQKYSEDLFALGIAAKKAHFLMPREMWHKLPGGMPYIAVN